VGIFRKLLTAIFSFWGNQKGMEQAKQVGEDMRKIVREIVPPGSRTPLGDSIPRKCVQLMSNNERRVKQTGLLVGQELLQDPTLEEEFIIDNTQSRELLDDVSAAEEIIEAQKVELHDIMHLSDASERPDLPTLAALVKKPLYTMQCVHKLMKELQIVTGNMHFCGQEPVDVLLDRWKRLRTGFYNPDKRKFDTTKIPDVFDFVTYDVQHNQKVCHPVSMYIGQLSLVPCRVVSNSPQHKTSLFLVSKRLCATATPPRRVLICIICLTR
jgi:hypothetical protein